MGPARLLAAPQSRAGPSKWSIRHVRQTVVLNGPKRTRKSARNGPSGTHGPPGTPWSAQTWRLKRNAIKTDVHHQGADPGAFPGPSPFGLPCFCACPREQCSNPDTARIPRYHPATIRPWLLAVSTQSLSAPARARNPQPSSFDAGFRRRSRQRQPNGGSQLCCSPRSWHKSMSSSLLWMPALR